MQAVDEAYRKQKEAEKQLQSLKYQAEQNRKIAEKEVQKLKKRIKSRNMKSKIVLQVHDEMMIETALEEVDEVKDILKEKMENAIKLRVPLIAEVSEATNWYDCK